LCIYIYNCNNIRECPVNADINLLCHGPVINDPIHGLYHITQIALVDV
jgi:hypothetical protein